MRILVKAPALNEIQIFGLFAYTKLYLLILITGSSSMVQLEKKNARETVVFGLKRQKMVFFCDSYLLAMPVDL